MMDSRHLLISLFLLLSVAIFSEIPSTQAYRRVWREEFTPGSIEAEDEPINFHYPRNVRYRQQRHRSDEDTRREEPVRWTIRYYGGQRRSGPNYMDEGVAPDVYHRQWPQRRPMRQRIRSHTERNYSPPRMQRSHNFTAGELLAVLEELAEQRNLNSSLIRDKSVRYGIST